MRNVACVAIAALALLASGCANKTDTGTTTAPGGSTAGSGTGSSAPAQAQLMPQNLEALMKKIGPTYQSLRKHLQDGATAEAGKEAQDLGELFGQVEKFWAQYNKDDAVQWAQQARTHASNAAGSAVGGDPRKAAAAAENMGGACRQCHGAYRESDGEGGYRIKPGILPSPN